MKEAFEGIKVADFGWVVVGPSLTKHLADHGALVVRVESSTHVDSLRTTGPFKGNKASVNRATFFAIYNNNKYGVTLNLGQSRGREIARRIVAWADIVSEGFTPGTMDRLGLGYEELKKIKPDIIMLSTCNMGGTGPYAAQPGLGVQLTALSGFFNLTGWPDREPALPYGGYTDLVASQFGAIAVIAALDYRRRTGKGQHLDLSQYEASIHFLTPLVLDFVVNGRDASRMGNRCPYGAPHGIYPCLGEDRWVAISVFTDGEWAAFCEVIGNPVWTKDPKFAALLGRKENEDELDKLVAEWTGNFTAEQVMTMMQSAGVGAGVVQNSADILQDPQLKHRRYFSKLEHPEIGKHTYQRSAFRLSKTPAQLRIPAPCLGEHNEYVFINLLGMSDEEFVELLADGVFD